MRGDDDLAAIVRAFAFQLIGPAGDVVAELTTTPALGGNDPELVFDHGDPSTADPSYIAWTHNTPGPGTVDLLRVAGPSNSTTLQSSGLQFGLNSAAGGNALVGLYAQDVDATSSVGLAMSAEDSGDAVAQLTASSGGFPNGLTAAYDTFAGVGYVDLEPADQTRLNGRQASLLVYDDRRACNLLINPVPVAGVDVGGTTFTTSMNAGDVAIIRAVFDVTKTVAGAGVFIGQLTINAVAQAGQANFDAPAVGARATVTQQWKFTAGTTANRTFRLRASQSAAGGQFQMNDIHTTIHVQIFATK